VTDAGTKAAASAALVAGAIAWLSSIRKRRRAQAKG
jgi:hypothetical protein